MTLADRATIANMAPEYGATCGIFPVDEQTMNYLRLTGRPEDHIALVEKYYKEQGLWYSPTQTEPEYTDTLELDLSTVEPSLAGPARPQDRVSLGKSGESFRKFLGTLFQKECEGLDKKQVDTWLSGTSIVPGQLCELSEKNPHEQAGKYGTRVPVRQPDGASYQLTQGSVVIAAITSCTNTSNPGVLIAAGLLAKKAVQAGINIKPWVKTSLAPGSKVVTDYLKEAGLLSYLEALHFHVVGYGCTTCIGNSGPLPEHVSKAVVDGDLAVVSVLSGNRNFEGRVNPHVRANYLASPPLVVAFALAGNINVDLTTHPVGINTNGEAVFLKDIWPSQEEVNELMSKFIHAAQFKKSYSDVFKGDEHWQSLKFPTGDLYKWDKDSTYIKEPPFFDEVVGNEPAKVNDIKKARVLALFGDSITTDHISPAGSFSAKSPAGQYLIQLGVDPKDFNSYGARRGNHEVMVRGTFANIRIKNQLVPGVEGGVTIHIPSGKQMSIYDAAMQYMADGVPTIVIAGKEYGTGSSRDWAAKGPKLQGVRAVIAESFERIHRSNLVGMGVLPLQFVSGENYKSLGLTGKETYEIDGLSELKPGQKIQVKVRGDDGSTKEFTTLSRIDTPNEVEYFKHGGILPYVLRQQLK
jgi:aconitate hydratase